MILVGSELSVVSGDTLWSFWSIGACGRQIPILFVTCTYLYIYLYMKRSESANCEEIGKVSRSAVSLQSLSDKVLSRVQSPPCHASPSSIFYSQPAPYSPHILGSHRGIKGVQGDPMAIQWLSMAIPYGGGQDAALTEVPQADGRGLGRFFFCFSCFWHRIPLESQTDIPSVRSKACWDGEGARAELTKLCRNSWGFRSFVFWSQEFLNMFYNRCSKADSNIMT